MKFSRRSLFALLVVACLALFAGCTTEPPPGPTPPLLLVSLDAFRWDYCDKFPAETPNLRQLRAEGSSARELIPVYPSNTFPNHYAIATGLYPAHSGIINNEMFDPTTNTFFRHNLAASAHASVWWGGEPIWITAVKQGHEASASFWVGSEAKIEGVYATHWKPYDYSIPFEKRLDELVSWMKPSADGPGSLVSAFYIEETNSVGHKFGPDSPQLREAVKLVDSRIGAIRTRLKAEHINANLVVVSDHGMTPISPDRVLILDDYLDMSSVQVDFLGPQAGLRPLEGTAESITRSLANLPHAKVYLSQDLPARFHLKDNLRISPVWVMPDEGWEVETRKHFAPIKGHFNHGDHGYDNAYRSMHAILIAAGPSFKSGVVIDPVENVHIYNLLCAVTHLTPAPNDGDDRLVKAFVK